MVHDNLSAQELSSLEAIKRNSNQLKMLISNILEISRIEAKKFELIRSKVDMNDLIKNVIVDLKILLKQKPGMAKAHRLLCARLKPP